MRPLQTMVAQDGYEVMLFPLTSLYVTQGENGNYSHKGILAIDFQGWDNGRRVYTAPMYAPCSCTCVATIDANNKGRIFQSNDLVHTPDGLKYVTFMYQKIMVNLKIHLIYMIHVMLMIQTLLLVMVITGKNITVE